MTDSTDTELDPTTFDLGAWIGGVTTTVRSVTLYQRPDLLARVDELQRQLRIAESLSEEDRGITDDSPASLLQELEQVSREFESSAITVKVQGQSDARRDEIAKKLKKKGITDPTEVTLTQLADAILEPQGMTVDVLRILQERSEPQVKLLLVASAEASMKPPRVEVPFSSESSGRKGRRRPS